jgi:hypothetical protein
MPDVDYHWPLDEGERMYVTKLGDGVSLKIEEIGPPFRKLHITYNAQGRMLFDLQDIETEDFMGFVGLYDDVEAIPLRVVYLENNW